MSDSDPVIQGDLSVSHDSGFSAGIWGSQYDVVTDDGVELDIILGYETEIGGGFAFNIGLTEYTFTGDTDSSTEYYTGLTYKTVWFYLLSGHRSEN